MIRRPDLVLPVIAMLFSGPAHGDGEPIGDGARNLPIFDAHVHYKEPAWGPFPPATVIRMFDRNGIAMALVSSTPDEGTIRLWKFAPVRVVPELRPYHGRWGSGNWMDFGQMAAYIDKRLEKYPHRGIGEFHVRTMAGVNRDLLAHIAKRALERNIPVHIHSDDAPVRLLFSIAPKLTVIWAHAGMISPPAVISPLMDRHKRLFADTSYRESDILRGGRLDRAWKALLMRHPDRFMVGSDTWANGQWENYDSIIARNRAWLALLPRAEAEMIAYRNAERLFGRKVTKSLIGRRH